MPLISLDASLWDTGIHSSKWPPVADSNTSTKLLIDGFLKFTSCTFQYQYQFQPFSSSLCGLYRYYKCAVRANGFLFLRYMEGSSKLTLKPFLLMYSCMSGCHWSTCCCENMSVVLAGTSRLFVRSLVWQPWLWITLSICFPNATVGYHELSPLSLSLPPFFNSFTCTTSPHQILLSISAPVPWPSAGAGRGPGECGELSFHWVAHIVVTLRLTVKITLCSNRNPPTWI